MGKNTRSTVYHEIDEICVQVAEYLRFGATGTTIDTLVAREVSAVIELDYVPGIPGRTDGPPEDCYPPEPAELHIHSIKASDNIRFEGEEMHLVVHEGFDLMRLMIERDVEALEEMLLDRAEKG